MSCFIVSDDHISAIIAAAHMYVPGAIARLAALRTVTIDDDYTGAGKILLRENIASFRHRYSNSDPASVQSTYRYTAPTRYPSVVGALKLIQCYRYQSCEHPQWDGSSADVFTRSLTEALITCLAGYDEAHWSI